MFRELPIRKKADGSGLGLLEGVISKLFLS